MPVHRTGIGPVTDMPDGRSGCRTQGTEPVTISITVLTWYPGSRSLASPHPAEHALLADTCRILEPDLNPVPIHARVKGILCHPVEIPAKLLLKPNLNLRMERAWGKFPKPQLADHPTDGRQRKGDLEPLIDAVPQP